MEVQVQSEANQYIPFSLDEVNLDFQVLGPAPSGEDEVEVLIAASRKEKIEDRVAAAEAAGLKTIVMDVESYASQCAFELICDGSSGVQRERRDGHRGHRRHGHPGDASCTTGRPSTRASSRSAATSSPRTSPGRSTCRPRRPRPPSGSAACPRTSGPDVLAPFNEKIVLEIQRALQFFFTSTQFNKVDHILLTGGCAMLDGLEEMVAQRTQVHTLVANPFANMALSSKIKPRQLTMDAPSLMVACGLAMRRFDPS